MTNMVGKMRDFITQGLRNEGLKTNVVRTTTGGGSVQELLFGIRKLIMAFYHRSRPSFSFHPSISSTFSVQKSIPRAPARVSIDYLKNANRVILAQLLFLLYNMDSQFWLVININTTGSFEKLSPTESDYNCVFYVFQNYYSIPV